MTQPSYVPIAEADQVRPARRLAPPPDWRQSRVAELTGPARPRGRGFGTPGPDQGYALLLAERLFSGRIRLQPGESTADVLAGAAAVAAARAALFGRAPVDADLEHALTLFGFLGDAPAELIAWRTPRFQAAAHDYDVRRALVDAVPEATLRLAPGELSRRQAEWRELVAAAG